MGTRLGVVVHHEVIKPHALMTAIKVTLVDPAAVIAANLYRVEYMCRHVRRPACSAVQAVVEIREVVGIAAGFELVDNCQLASG